jgi:Rha family phage regulatory protein
MKGEVRVMHEVSTIFTKEKTISSLEVAEMVGKEHKELLRDIRRYCEQLGESKIALTDFFTESTYRTNQNKELPCYMVTKKGCEFIAHKLTGVKGTKFTALYINRFHEMEDYIKKESRESKIEQSAFLLKFVADDLRVNEASRLLMYENLCKDFDIPTGFLPKYEHNGSRQLKSLSALLEENHCGISAVKFNKLLLETGYLEERERQSSKGNGVKKLFKALTEKGLKYGENAVSPHNQKEVQPLYYSDLFVELFECVNKLEM